MAGSDVNEAQDQNVSWVLRFTGAADSPKTYRSKRSSPSGPIFEDSGVLRWCLEFLRYECGVSTGATFHGLFVYFLSRTGQRRAYPQSQ